MRSSAALATPTQRLRVRTRAVDDPGDLLGRLPEPSGLVWLRGNDAMVGWGEAARIDVGSGHKRFDRASAALGSLADHASFQDDAEAPGRGLVAFGSFTFDPRVGGSVVVVPRVLLARRSGRAWVAVVDPPTGRVEPFAGVVPGPVAALPAIGRIRYAGASMPEVRWLEAVAAAVSAIERGELAKVVLARDLVVWAEQPIDPRSVARRLSEHFPDCFTFCVDGLVGASPELLVRRAGSRVTSLVLAGSAARGAGPEADATLGRTLLASGKDLREHQFAVTSVVDRLARLCDTLEVAPAPTLLRLENVQHLATAVEGTLRGPQSALDVAGALHPTAAVCGTPTDAARAHIRATEGLDRGRYGGPVGWVDAHGDGEWAIALRCAQLDGARARLFAGAGIVAGSLPEAELEETRLKLRAMQSALES